MQKGTKTKVQYHKIWKTRSARMGGIQWTQPHMTKQHRIYHDTYLVLSHDLFCHMTCFVTWLVKSSEKNLRDWCERMYVWMKVNCLYTNMHVFESQFYYKYTCIYCITIVICRALSFMVYVDWLIDEFKIWNIIFFCCTVIFIMLFAFYFLHQ
jgi:hypothetical protein